MIFIMVIPLRLFAKGDGFCGCLVNRGFASAKGNVFYVPFFGAKERNQRKALKGD